MESPAPSLQWPERSRLFEAPLHIAFESEQPTYSDLAVDLYNSGINQILSVAATRGHRLFHFRMRDLEWNGEVPEAEMSELELDPGWDGTDPLHAHRHLRIAGRRRVSLAEIQLFVVRGDDIRTEETRNLSALRWASDNAKVLESVEATLSTTDKYRTVERAPQLPHPVTFPASTPEEVRAALAQLPRSDGSFVLKDRYGFGCGKQVHRLRFDDPATESELARYLEEYHHLLLQEYCPEIEEGDIVVTFFDDELIGALRRRPAEGQWKTNASFGAKEGGCNLTPMQQSIAHAVKRSFPECRLASVDLLESGRIIEINAFPGGQGLLESYGIAIGEIVMDRMERELLGVGAEEAAPAALTWSDETLAAFPTGTAWDEVEELYARYEGEREVFDVFSGDRYRLGIRDLIRFEPRSPEYIVSVPHAGVFLPDSFRDRFRLGERSLVEIDLYSDLLYEMADGLHVVCELTPFFIDMNRDREGSDEGELPRHLTNAAHEYYDVRDQPMLLRPYTPKEEERVLEYHDLYHGLLSALIERMKRERGYALLFDCHSMTSTGLGRVADEGQPRDSFVVGTLEGSSAASGIIEAFSDALVREVEPHGLDLSVRLDEPYSGGFITRLHHHPEDHVHVLQLEVAMDTYMYEVVEPPAKRYALKKPRLRICRQAVRAAFRAAAEAAERIYWPPRREAERQTVRTR